MNIVLDVNVVLDLLLRREPAAIEKARLFDRLRVGGARLWVAASALPTLEYVHAAETKALVQRGRLRFDGDPREFSRRQLAKFLSGVQVASSLGAHSKEIPPDHRDWEDALISLAAADLPGETVLWTEDGSFRPVVDIPIFDFQGLGTWLDRRQTQPEPVPFVDLVSQQMAVRSSLERRVSRVLKHGQYIMGPEVRELEQKLSAYVGVKHGIGCSSGTDALLLPLLASGIGPGDAVFTTPFTFIATAEVISLLGATPVFVDIDPFTYNIDPKQLDKAIRAVKSGDPTLHPLPTGNRELGTGNAGLRPAAVIAVDLYGLTADYDALQGVCTEHGLALFEDAAQSFGAEYKGKKACAFGDAAATSFFPAKPLGCYGDGGMVFTDRDDLAEICRSLLVHGKGTDKYDNVRIGLNARLDTLQAAVVLAKFEAFPEEVEKRQEVARAYSEALAAHPSLRPPHVPEGYKSGWAQYTVRIGNGQRAAWETAFKQAGVPSVVYYPKPLHLQTAFVPLGYRPGDFPESERASTEVLSLPFGPYLQGDSGKRVVAAVGAS